MDTRIAGSCWWHVGLDTPRSGVERRVWSPPPAMGRRRGGHPLCGVLMMAACWVGHPTEWGGEDNVVPPARDGQEARWTPLCGVLLMAACWGRRPGPPCSDGAVGRIHGTGCHDKHQRQKLAPVYVPSLLSVTRFTRF